MRTLDARASAGGAVYDELACAALHDTHLAAQRRHGRATNITWVGLTVVAPRAAAVYVNVFEENADPGEPYGCVMPNASVLRNDTHWMTVQGAVFRDVRVRELGATALGGCFNCAPGTPCALRLEQVALPESAAFVCHNEGAGLSQFCGRRL